MLKEKKEQARDLRKQGFSINDIYRKLLVAKGSVSVWVRDIELTAPQKKVLQDKAEKFRAVGQTSAKIAVHNKYLNIRKDCQKQGKELVQKHGKDYAAGVSLFWAEGSKCRNQVKISNGDPDLLKFFLSFLRKYFLVSNEDIAFAFQWYSNNGITIEEVKRFWMEKLDIDESCFRKCYVDYRPVKNMGRKVGKLPYGVGRLSISDVTIVQKLYGSIQEIAGFDRPAWIK